MHIIFFFTKIPKGRSVIYILRLDDKKILKNQANPFAIKICEDKKNYNKKIGTNKHISYTIACQFKLKKLRLLSSQFTSSLKNIQNAQYSIIGVLHTVYKFTSLLFYHENNWCISYTSEITYIFKNMLLNQIYKVNIVQPVQFIKVSWPSCKHVKMFWYQMHISKGIK